MFQIDFKLFYKKPGKCNLFKFSYIILLTKDILFIRNQGPIVLKSFQKLFLAQNYLILMTSMELTLF